jgi:hypothetical protein
MTMYEAREFWHQAKIRLGFSNGVVGSWELAKLLGLEYPYVGYWDKIPLTPELKRKLILLTGPYAEVFKKIMEKIKE